jgi:hypothetical protein
MTDPYAAVLADLQAQRERIDIAIGAIKALRPDIVDTTGPLGIRLHLSMDEDGEAPPPPPLKPKRAIPSDPDALRAAAIQMMDQGYGMNEVREELELTESQAQSFFYGK